MRDERVIDLSFVIPAFNEADLIVESVENIRRHAPAGYGWEIIVVDNASTDSTYEVASKLGQVQAIRASGTVGAARNTGVGASHGRVLVFLDADVRLTEQWTAAVPALLRDLATPALLLSGSTVRVPAQAGWLERSWFEPATRKRRSYINSGHLIVTRRLFDTLGGFDPALRTGEDVDFSHRAAALGASIRDDAALVAIHLGFPKTLGAFARRELWHGQGDVGSLRRLLQSKVALISLLVAALTLGALGAALMRWVPWAVAMVAAIALICTASGIKKSASRDPLAWLSNSFLYYVYFLCRAAAVFTRRDGWRQRAASSPAVHP